jgi:uncharacterized protein (TIGR00645 family)
MLPMLGHAILVSRYLLVVFFFGLMLGLALFALRFIMELWQLATRMFELEESDMLIELLLLLDATLVASLVVMVALSSYDSLVDRLQGEADQAQMRWISRTDHSNLKIKVATAMVAISSIHLLQVFLRIGNHPAEQVMWQVVIYLVFLVGAVMLGVLDRIGNHAAAAAQGRNETL